MQKANSTIIHLDLDAFYASVEQQDNPDLRGRKVIVGGSRERGVVCACSYETRPFGVRSGIAIREALRLCPEAIVLPVRMGRYREISRQIFEIYSAFTDLVEPLSIDEAFLDVTGSLGLLGDGLIIAKNIKTEVRCQTGLTLSAGIAPNKLLAKLASEAGKPDGLFMLNGDRIEPFLQDLQVSALWGVGPKTQQQLRALGVDKVKDLRRLNRETLILRFGKKAGSHLFQVARGIDERPVERPGQPKSVGCERTFEADMTSHDGLMEELLRLADQVGSRLREKGLKGRTIGLKVKYADFHLLTRRTTLPAATNHGQDIYRAAKTLFLHLDSRKPIRLLGLTISGFIPRKEGQVSLFADSQEGPLCRLDATVDKIRLKFGQESILPGSLLGKKRRE
jgi:DNA polymerase-4